MPYSTQYLKEEIKKHFLTNVGRETKILDAGAGCGTYSDLLKNKFPYIDGVEIFPDYVDMFNLHSKYNHLFVANILDFDISAYDYIILGDIIEHMTFVQARNFLDKIESLGKKCLVGVPYNYPQGASMGNTFETHLQDDLTEKLFLQRYPNMVLVMGNDEYGYFVNYKDFCRLA
jgi:hypothetical protein